MPDTETAAVPVVTAAIVKAEPADIFQMFDSLDDDVIAAELEGRLTDVATYHFSQGGKELWGLGKVGVDMCVTEMGKKGIAVRDDDVEWALDPTDPTYVIFKAKAHRHFIGKDGSEAEVDGAIGVKRQWTKMERRDGTKVTDPFWAEKGAMKAIRNARMRLIPEEIKAQVIAFAKDKGRVKEVSEDEIRGRGRQTTGARVGRGANPGEASRPSPAPPNPSKPAPVRIHLVRSDGKAVDVDMAGAMRMFAAVKQALGDAAYYAVLGQAGFEHANEITYAEMPKVYAELIRATKLGFKA